jgi:hypothetical protein
MKYLLFLLIFILPISCFAQQNDEYFVGFGVGLAESAVSSAGETKMFNLGERKFLFQGIYWQNKLGYWGDGSGNPQRKSSLFVSSGIGMEVDLAPVELRAGTGLAIISTPDEYLGGRFPQFSEDLGITLRDKHGDGIGLTYSHFSSAGIVSPNIGRDFVTLELSVKWW